MLRNNIRARIRSYIFWFIWFMCCSHNSPEIAEAVRKILVKYARRKLSRADIKVGISVTYPEPDLDPKSFGPPGSGVR
jgi:hypothetical protein